MTEPTTVLVVEDDPDTRKLIQFGLESEGYSVLTAPDGQAALDVLSGGAVNLILLDMHMPVMDGWTFVRNYHRQQPPWVPVVVVTASQGTANPDADIGVDGHLDKPFELDELLATVQRNLVPPYRAVGNVTGIYRHDARTAEERDASEARARLTAIVDSSDDAIIGKTLDGAITSWNAAAERLYGYTAAEVMGRSIALLAPKDRDDEMPGLLERIRRGERISHYETERRHKDGRRLSVSLSLSPIQNADGAIVGAAAIAHDITARQHRESVLQRYRMLVGNTRDIVLFIGLDGRILECNTAALAAYGYERAELLELSIADLRVPAQRSLAPEQLRQAELAGVVFETVHQRKDGTSFPLEVSWVAEDIGNARILLSIARDITQRRAAEADRRLQSTALEAAANAIIITDRHGDIQWANPAFSQLTGYSKDEVFGQNPRLLKSGQQDAAFYKDLWQTILAGQVWRGQMTNRRKNGQLYTVAMTITPVRDAAGEISHFIAIKEDITQRLEGEAMVRAATADMQAATAEMEAAQHIAHLGSWELDLTFLEDVNRNTLHWSDECFSIFGYEPGEVEVTPDFFYARVHDEDRAAVSAAVDEAITTRTPSHIEYRIVLRDGSERIVQQSNDVMCDTAGRASRLVGTAQDITERRRIEAELAGLLMTTQVAQREAESAVRVRDEFLLIAAHELKTPVTAIKLTAQLLAARQEQVTQDTTKMTRMIQSLEIGASRLARLTDDLLDVARLQTGTLTVRREALDLSEMVRRVAATYQSRLRTGQQLEIEGAVAACMVRADPARLQQVLTNLLDNSIKYSPDGGVIRLCVRPAVDGCVVHVEDHGMGLPDGSEETIFQPFGRAKNAAVHAIQGMGLGLYICRQIVAAHDGRLWAASAGVDLGVTMHLWLP